MRVHNPRTIEPSDRFLVVNKTTGNDVQSSYTEQDAQHAVETLNDHEVRNGRKPVYFWRAK